MYLLLFFLPLLSTVECRFAGSSSDSLLFSGAKGQQIWAFRYTDFISEFLVTDALFRNKFLPMCIFQWVVRKSQEKSIKGDLEGMTWKEQLCIFLLWEFGAKDSTFRQGQRLKVKKMQETLMVASCSLIWPSSLGTLKVIRYSPLWFITKEVVSWVYVTLTMYDELSRGNTERSICSQGLVLGGVPHKMIS